MQEGARACKDRGARAPDKRERETTKRTHAKFRFYSHSYRVLPVTDRCGISVCQFDAVLYTTRTATRHVLHLCPTLCDCKPLPRYYAAQQCEGRCSALQVQHSTSQTAIQSSSPVYKHLRGKIYIYLASMATAQLNRFVELWSRLFLRTHISRGIWYLSGGG